jgi:hypothetical protein
MPVSETVCKITLISAEGGGVPEERVGPNCSFVTVRAALKRQVVLTNHVVQSLGIADGKTLVFSDQVIRVNNIRAAGKRKTSSDSYSTVRESIVIMVDWYGNGGQ